MSIEDEVLALKANAIAMVQAADNILNRINPKPSNKRKAESKAVGRSIITQYALKQLNKK